MERNITKKLLKWKESENRKPLVLLGARQVGKTYIIKDFGDKYYDKLIYINFNRKSEYKSLFEKDIDPKRIIEGIEIIEDISIDSESTLIFFDEIQECSEAISSLKYFNEELCQYHIICAGSLLGTMIMREKFFFPVGNIELMRLYPMRFDEFLVAMGSEKLLNTIVKSFNNNIKLPDPIHSKAIDLYKYYLCIGGYPEVVKNFIDNDKNLKRMDDKIKTNILDGYFADMTKYTSNSDSVKITAIYKSIPEQLAKPNRKFKYSVVKSGTRANDYINSIDWLLESATNLICHAIKKSEFPLDAYKVDNTFKLYLNDVGLLNELAGIPYRDIIFDGDNIYKGSIAENYVATCLASNGMKLYYYKDNRYEIDFIARINDELIPIEVKAADNIVSTSLKSYIEKYKPKYTIRVSTKNFGLVNGIKSVPLYATFLIRGDTLY